MLECTLDLILTTYKGAHNEEHNEGPAAVGCRGDVAETNSGHGNKEPVDTHPVVQLLRVGLIGERVPIVLTLRKEQSRQANIAIIRQLYAREKKKERGKERQKEGENDTRWRQREKDKDAERQ